MVKALNENSGSVELLKRIPPFQEPVTKGLHNFVITSTMRFFHILELSEDFLQYDPSEWVVIETYQRSREVAQSVKEVNDLAKGCLVQEFQCSLTRNEEQRQFLLQVVEERRKLSSAPTQTSAILGQNRMIDKFIDNINVNALGYIFRLFPKFCSQYLKLIIKLTHSYDFDTLIQYLYYSCTLIFFLYAFMLNPAECRCNDKV